MEDRIIDPNIAQEDSDEVSLRPSRLSQFIGQERVKKNLQTFLEAAKTRDPKKLGKGEGILDHILFYGPPGLGKTTLAVIVASELGVSLKRTTGKALERAGDVAAILTGLSEGDILFVDEIHRMNPQIEETFYSAMEDFRFDIVLGKGPSARTITLPLNRFTLIGATTRISLLSSPLRDRFGIIERLEYYTPPELAEVAKRASKALGV
ncbi:MAG TPA: AAA family ATPase, partial [Caldisericia bacterium]|nr:AAA family ATPase [Caldisericia bacterium]